MVAIYLEFRYFKQSNFHSLYFDVQKTESESKNEMKNKTFLVIQNVAIKLRNSFFTLLRFEVLCGISLAFSYLFSHILLFNQHSFNMLLFQSNITCLLRLYSFFKAVQW